ncbi:MAG: DUF4405 domain-containing protein [Pelolinea sp.]|jgi:hypothetical protein|nr:DUF4405 domain-containing protein [Pelolinea sp.]
MEKTENVKTQSIGKILTHLVLDVGLLVSFILLNHMRSTGKSLHEILGTAIGAMILIHLILHWKMILGYFKRIFKSHQYLPILRLIVNSVLLVCLFAIIITGLMMSRSLLPSLGIQVGRAGREIEMLHKMITRYTIYVLGLHLILQWRWYLLVIKRLFINPVASLMGKRQNKEIA